MPINPADKTDRKMCNDGGNLHRNKKSPLAAPWQPLGSAAQHRHTLQLAVVTTTQEQKQFQLKTVLTLQSARFLSSQHIRIVRRCPGKGAATQERTMEEH